MRNKKSLLLLAASATLAFGFVACKPSISSKGADSSLDSVAMARGYVQGDYFSQQISFAKQMGQNINTEKLLQGFRDGIAASNDSAAIWYYQGLMMGHQAGAGNIEDKVNNKLFFEYFEAAYKGDSTKTKWTKEDMNAYLEAAEKKINDARMAKQMEEQREKYSSNIKEGEDYMAEYKKGEGVVTLPSGVAYKVITPGDGKNFPQATDKVNVKYDGHFINGESFDKSDEPISFNANQVIPGWTEVLQKMSVGEKIEVVIPYDQAYGEAGSGKIEPFKTLVFTIELVSIEKPKANEATK